MSRPPGRPLEPTEREHFTEAGKPKRAYQDRAAARAIAKEINREHRPEARMVAYKCSRCGLFHVGRQPQERPE